MKLPAELRNDIYEEILPIQEVIHIRGHAHRNVEVEGSWNARGYLWREPQLLRVSKQIRREVSSLYYGQNYFTVCLHDGEIDKAVQWVRHNEAMRNLDVDFNFKFTFTSASWALVESWYPLVALAYELDWDFADAAEERHYFSNEFFDLAFRGSKFQEALEHVVTMGVRARQRGTPLEILMEDCDAWARTTLAITTRRFSGW